MKGKDDKLPNGDANEAAPKTKRSRRRLALIGAGGLVLLCVCVAVFASLGNGDDEEEPAVAGEVEEVAAEAIVEEPVDTPAEPLDAPTPTNTPEPTNTPSPTETPAPPTATPEPTVTLSPFRALNAALADAIGTSNRDVVARIQVADQDGTLEVSWAINDNLTENMIRRGAMIDIVDMLKVFAIDIYPYNTVIFEGTFPLVDQFGNSSEQAVVVAIYDRETVERINFDNFLTDNVYAIADDLILHPAFRE